MYIVDASSSESPSLTPKQANAPPQGQGDLESPVAALTPSHGKDLFVNVPPTPPQHTLDCKLGMMAGFGTPIDLSLSPNSATC